MKKDLVVAYSLFLLLLVSCSKGPAFDEMKAAADQIDDQLVEAINTKDLKTFSSLYWQSAQLVILDDNAFIIGLSKWKSEIARWFKERPQLKMKFSKPRNVVSDNLVLGHREWDAQYIDENGQVHLTSGLYHDVKAFRDGKWVIVSQTFVQVASKEKVAVSKYRHTGC